MDLRPITDQFAVAPQILPEDVPGIAEAGYRSIICNRPDDEDYGQACCGTIEEAAEAAGLSFLMLPIASGVVTQEAAEAFKAALRDMPGPILAYCRSGTRCTMLWTIAQYGEMGSDEIIRKTGAAGYEMSGLIGQLKAMQRS